jgi:hypothetical protein
MLDSLIPLLALGLAAAFWLDALKAHECARGFCLQLCERGNVQLLDQTVALHRMTICRGKTGWLALRRSYNFELSTDGADRRQGRLTMIGQRLDSYSLPVAHAVPDALH